MERSFIFLLVFVLLFPVSSFSEENLDNECLKLMQELPKGEQVDFLKYCILLSESQSWDISGVKIIKEAMKDTIEEYESASALSKITPASE